MLFIGIVGAALYKQLGAGGPAGKPSHCVCVSVEKDIMNAKPVNLKVDF